MPQIEQDYRSQTCNDMDRQMWVDEVKSYKDMFRGVKVRTDTYLTDPDSWYLIVEPNEEEHDMLYEVAIIQRPTKKAKDNGDKSVILVPPTAVMSENEEAAKLDVTLQFADKIPEDRTGIEILVRVFG